MPQVSMFLDSEDERSLITLLFEKGARIVADLRYDGPAYHQIHDWSGYDKARGKSGLFFVLFDAYERCPLRMFRIEGGHYDGKYSVMQRTGGPTIDLLSSVQYRKDDIDFISDGMLGYHRTYRNTLTDDIEEVPDELVTLFNLVSKEIKKNCAVVKAQGGRTYLIGPHTYQRTKDGRLTLGVDGLAV